MPRLMVDESLIHGTVEPGFEPVMAEFKRNFLERGEVGAACAAYVGNDKVVDLWGGYRDHKTREPWSEDTLVMVFSTTKGVSGLTVALAHSRGLLDYEERVSTYWPEFAQKGKENVTVRQLLSHQAGLPVIDEPLGYDELADPDAVARALAEQAPAWEPGTRQGYHAVSLGLYEGELIRRVDPAHRTLGQYFQDEIAKPLELEFYIGAPSRFDNSRLAAIKFYEPLQVLRSTAEMPARFMLSALNPRSLASRSIKNPDFTRPNEFSSRRFREVEMPASNGIGQVRSIARAYCCFATGGAELGIGEETLEALTGPPKLPPTGFQDYVLKMEACYSLGFSRPTPGFRFGAGLKSYGTTGAGGSFGFADPEAGVGWAYAMNRMELHMHFDPREKALRDALYRCL